MAEEYSPFEHDSVGEHMEIPEGLLDLFGPQAAPPPPPPRPRPPESPRQKKKKKELSQKRLAEELAFLALPPEEAKVGLEAEPAKPSKRTKKAAKAAKPAGRLKMLKKRAEKETGKPGSPAAIPKSTHKLQRERGRALRKAAAAQRKHAAEMRLEARAKAEPREAKEKKLPPEEKKRPERPLKRPGMLGRFRPLALLRPLPPLPLAYAPGAKKAPYDPYKPARRPSIVRQELEAERQEQAYEEALQAFTDWWPPYRRQGPAFAEARQKFVRSFPRHGYVVPEAYVPESGAPRLAAEYARKAAQARAQGDLAAAAQFTAAQGYYEREAARTAAARPGLERIALPPRLAALPRKEPRVPAPAALSATDLPDPDPPAWLFRLFWRVSRERQNRALALSYAQLAEAVDAHRVNLRVPISTVIYMEANRDRLARKYLPAPGESRVMPAPPLTEAQTRELQHRYGPQPLHPHVFTIRYGPSEGGRLRIYTESGTHLVFADSPYGQWLVAKAADGMAAPVPIDMPVFKIVYGPHVDGFATIYTESGKRLVYAESVSGRALLAKAATKAAKAPSMPAPAEEAPAAGMASEEEKGEEAPAQPPPLRPVRLPAVAYDPTARLQAQPFVPAFSAALRRESGAREEKKAKPPLVLREDFLKLIEEIPPRTSAREAAQALGKDVAWVEEARAHLPYYVSLFHLPPPGEWKEEEALLEAFLNAAAAEGVPEAGKKPSATILTALAEALGVEPASPEALHAAQDIRVNFDRYMQTHPDLYRRFRAANPAIVRHYLAASAGKGLPAGPTQRETAPSRYTLERLAFPVEAFLEAAAAEGIAAAAAPSKKVLEAVAKVLGLRLAVDEERLEAEEAVHNIRANFRQLMLGNRLLYEQYMASHPELIAFLLGGQHELIPIRRQTGRHKKRRLPGAAPAGELFPFGQGRLSELPELPSEDDSGSEAAAPLPAPPPLPPSPASPPRPPSPPRPAAAAKQGEPCHDDPKCGPGKVRNPKTRRCVSTQGAAYKRDCLGAGAAQPQKPRKRPKPAPAAAASPAEAKRGEPCYDDPKCGPGKVRNPKTRRCVSTHGAAYQRDCLPAAREPELSDGQLKQAVVRLYVQGREPTLRDLRHELGKLTASAKQRAKSIAARLSALGDRAQELLPSLLPHGTRKTIFAELQSEFEQLDDLDKQYLRHVVDEMVAPPPSLSPKPRSRSPSPKPRSRSRKPRKPRQRKPELVSLAEAKEARTGFMASLAAFPRRKQSIIKEMLAFFLLGAGKALAEAPGEDKFREDLFHLLEKYSQYKRPDAKALRKFTEAMPTLRT